MNSCSYQIYPKSTLDFNYDMNMTSKDELNAKSNVQIFLAAEDIKDEYEVLAYVKYHPMIIVPIIATEKSQQLKKFYKKAVLKAQDLGGNGVIITSIGDFRVIDIPALKETAPAEAQMISPIFRSLVLKKFEDGSIYTVNERQRVKYITMLEDEITSNLKACKTLEESEYISKKIEALKNYYTTSKKSTKVIDKKIQAFETSALAVEKKIRAKETKAGKKAGAVTDDVNSKVDKLMNIFNKK